MAGGYHYSGAITVEMFIPPNQELKYADFVATQGTEFSYVVQFFQLQPPALENAAALEAFQTNPRVPALCVGRFAIPRATALQLLNDLQRVVSSESPAPENK